MLRLKIGKHFYSEIKVKKGLRQGDATAPVLFNAKGKAIPLQAWTGPEGFRRVRLTDFKTVST